MIGLQRNLPPAAAPLAVIFAFLIAVGHAAPATPTAPPAGAAATRMTVTNAVATQTEVPDRLEILDGQLFGPTIRGGLSNDPCYPAGPVTWLQDAGNTRIGALADGLSVLVIRLISPPSPAQSAYTPLTEPFPVTFTISDAAGDGAAVIGSISSTLPSLPAPMEGAASPPGQQPSLTVTIPAGQPVCIFYCPPEQWQFFAANESSDLSLASLQNAQIAIQASSASGPLATAPLDVVRPQILLVHGICSGPGTWNQLISRFTGAGQNFKTSQFYAVDYSQTNTSGYDLLGSFVPSVITNLVSDDRYNLAVAATRLDVVAHSMGGALTAWYAGDLGNITVTRGDGFPGGSWNSADWPYRRANDFGIGDIRRFVSIGSPFDGSPWASLVCNDFTAGQISYIIQLNISTASGNGEAVWDLQTNSSATGFLERSEPQIEWCPIAGIAGSNALGSPWSALYSIFNITTGGVGLTGTNSDLVVATASAKNAAGTPGNSQDTEIGNLVHTAETNNTQVFDDVAKALDFTADGGKIMFNGQF